MFACKLRIASGNNTNKSESDQEDNDDVNDNDWSYGAEKKGETIMSLFFLQCFRMVVPNFCPQGPPPCILFKGYMYIQPAVTEEQSPTGLSAVHDEADGCCIRRKGLYSVKTASWIYIITPNTWKQKTMIWVVLIE